MSLIHAPCIVEEDWMSLIRAPCIVEEGWMSLIRAPCIVEEDRVSLIRAPRPRHERLMSLLVERAGHSYGITPTGLDLLQQVAEADSAGSEPDPDQTLRQLLKQQKLRFREAIRDLLADIDPYAFEHLVRRLLEEMGYEDAEVTVASHDKGVDVVARIELGITSVREVVQVKRHRANIQRPVLDALHGSLRPSRRDHST